MFVVIIFVFILIINILLVLLLDYKPAVPVLPRRGWGGDGGRRAEGRQRALDIGQGDDQHVYNHNAKMKVNNIMSSMFTMQR